MGKILTGISAWSDHGLVESDYYPKEVKTPAERLRYYGSEFPLAEIDTSYHYFPTRRNLDLWLDNTPEGFTFDIRAFSLFTGHPTPMTSLPRAFRDKFGDRIEAKGNIYPHHLPEEALEDLWKGFAGIAGIIAGAGKLGTVLFQFPPWFHPGEENRRYLGQCRKRLPRFRLAIGFRACSWLDDEHRERTLKTLREHGLALACVDEPQGFRSSLPPLAEVTASPGFVRFHGRNAGTWEKKGVPPDERFNYLYDEAELKEWLPKVRRMSEQADEVHLVFKNKHADFPVRNARQFGELLDQPV